MKYGKLNVKNFGTVSDSDSGQSIDLGSFEENPKFKAKEEVVTETPESPETPENNDKPESVETTTAPESNDKPSDDKPDKPEGSEKPSDSSLKDKPETEVQVPSVTEEMILKSLSEKLGREVKNFDELTQKQQEELNPQIKELNEWVKKYNRPVEDFFKFQKDYSKVSDIEVAREYLQNEYPTLTPEELNLELENYIVTEDDLESDAAKKSLELKKLATKGRKALDSLKGELTPLETSLPDDVKQKVQFADQVQQRIKDSEVANAQYTKGISDAAKVSEGLKLKLSDDLSIDFKISDADKTEIPTLIQEMPHWRTEDGNWNHQAVVNDAIKIKHFDAMIKLAYEQGLNAGKEDVIKKAKNTTLGNDVPVGGEQGQGNKKPLIEGIDKILQKQQGLKMRF